MRNFITTFLLLILFISIFSAIFAPKNTKKSLEEESNNKSRVEKLLTEPNQSFKVEDEQKVEAETQQKPIEKVPEIKVLNKNNLPDKTIDNTAQTKDAEKISIPKNSKELSDEILDRNQITKNEIPRTNNKTVNKTYEQSVQDLITKYNNNPNANVSEEDLKQILQKTFENYK